MKTYTILLAWGDAEEGNYHWAGQAENEKQALAFAREEMDDSYNETYCKNESDDWMRRKGTKYILLDMEEGVNAYAAQDMLNVLRELRQYLASSCAIHEPPLAGLLQRTDAAIARGEGTT
jgi:hypothetical protein